VRIAVLLPLLALAACNLVPPDLEDAAYDPDGDGVPWPEDCDSGSADVYPGADEIWYDGVDQDCGGDDDFDQDGDGFVPAEYEGVVTEGVPGSGTLPAGDCDDLEAAVNPDAIEVWYDGVDQDCDEASDYDADADGFEHADHGGDDCDDEDPAINPEATEVWYDGVDQDCDDNDCDQDGDGLDADPDGDGDGYCDQVDCDDEDPEVGGTEVWYDGVDQDCDGNDGDQDGDGYWAADYEQLVSDAGGTPMAVPTGFDGDCWDVPYDVGGYPADYVVINGYPSLDAHEVYPGADDSYYDAVDQDCAGDGDFDQDGDGAAADDVADRDGITGTDCDDSDPGIGPGSIETWYDGVDQTCDGNDGDQDRDAFWASDYDERVLAAGGTPLSIPSGYEGDCDDFDSSIFPGAPEYCDAVDSDCDGSTDDDDAVDTSTWYADLDGDGWGDPASATIECLQPTGYVSDSSDCDDANAAVNPGALEVCDGIDDDCDSLVDHDDPDILDALLWYPDSDVDGFGDASDAGTLYCSGSEPLGWTMDSSDCDDGDPAQYPSAVELCNGEDDDCDGTSDEDDAADVVTWYADTDMDGYGDPAVTDVDCSQPPGFVAVELATDCDDADPGVYPGAIELVADGVDSDCDGQELCYEDLDADSYGTSTTVGSSDLACDASGEAAVATDCDDSDASVNPGATDLVADGVDSDCDGFEACYEDLDGDSFGSTSTISSPRADCSGSGESLLSTDCDDADPGVYPGASEQVGDGVDSDCDGLELCYEDLDGDAVGSSATVSTSTIACSDSGQATSTGDCDDSDASIWPGAPETIADGVDQDCDGGDTCYEDLDVDGYGSSATVSSADLACDASGESSLSSDCDDGSAAVNPGATDTVADGVDGDCDGVELCYADSDGDGYGTSSTTTSVDLDCSDAGESAYDSDCDDGDGAQFPGADEYCNSEDDDCDGTTDESDAVDAPTWYVDGDSDGWGLDALSAVQCEQPSGYVADGGDCDDTLSSINPDATETVADGVDQDCDGGDSCYVDSDGDSYGVSSTVGSTDLDCADAGEAGNDSDCDDTSGTINPGSPELCNGADDDCDGTTDEDDAVDATLWALDADLDGYGSSATSTTSCAAPAGYVDAALGEDCDDADSSINPGETELCNSVDDDCDGTVDEDDAADAPTWYLDLDADGYGLDDSSTAACTQPSGYAAVGADCDDDAAAVNPGAVEICSNGIDDDCDDAAVGCTPSGDLDITAADHSFWGEDTADLAGYGVAWAGDVDGDGSSDLLVAARESDAAGIYAGSVYLVLGPSPGDDTLDGAELILRGESYGDYAGASVTGAGDVDGDGYEDIFVGASGNDSGGGNAGAAYLVYGPSSGEQSLSSADARFTGEDSGDQAGWSVSAAGDVDGDGNEDLLVGAFGSDAAGNNAGAAFVIRGPVTGDASLTSSSARLIGETAGDYAGRSVSGVGDVDGDGLDDLLVGAPYNATGGTDAGTAYLVLDSVSGDLGLGSADARLIGDASDEAGAAVAGAGDVNGDGLDDMLVGAPSSDTAATDAGAAYLVLGPVLGDYYLSGADARLLGDDAGDEAGGAVCGDGDVDDDGYADMLVGATSDSTAASAGGAAYLVLGPLSGDHSLSDADARILGSTAGTGVGSSLALGGDVNGDAYDDILLGASLDDTTGTDAGAAFVFLGGGL